MKLRYKITLIMIVMSAIAHFIAILYLSSSLFKDRLYEIKSRLKLESEDLALYIESGLLEKLDVIKTLQNTDIVEKTLLQNNREFSFLSKEARKEKIAELNTKWMSIKNSKDLFIQRYTNNQLAIYLKKQKNLLRGVYGEIFITNRYGVLVATSNRLTTLAHAQKYWWQESYNRGTGKYFFDDRGYDDSVKGYVLGIVVPIKKDGKIIGIIKANINVKSLLLKIINNFDAQSTEKVRVVRTKGLIVLEKNRPPLSVKIPLFLVKKLKKGIKGLVEFQNKIIAYAPIKLSLNSKDIVFGGKKQSIDHSLGNDGEIWNIVITENRKTIADNVLEDVKSIAIISFVFVIILGILIYIIFSKISLPIRKLSIVANKIGKGERDILIEPETNDEVGELAVALRDMLKDLKNTTASRDELEQEIKRRVEIQEEIKKKDQIILAQSRNAAMGEMISMIAHQWRQPLSVISMVISNALVSIELEELGDNDIQECAKEIMLEVNFLSKTIDDFRDFFKPTKQKEDTTANKLLNEAKAIIGKSLQNNEIKLTFEGDLDIEFRTYARELLQVFINIINNAKDAYQDKSVENKEIKIVAKKEKNLAIFKICDNAGGVEENVIDKIFQPYFSTKEEKIGTGLGLYMCKIIIEKHLFGKIWVKNTSEGACFMVEFPIAIKKEISK